MEHKCPYCGSKAITSCEEYDTNDTIEVYMQSEDCEKVFWEIYHFAEVRKEEEMYGEV